MAAVREIEIEASPAEVWEALATEHGRERWLDEGQEILVESEQQPRRLVWWWWHEDQRPTRVEFILEAVSRGTRVIVIESEPSVPVAALRAHFALVLA